MKLPKLKGADTQSCAVEKSVGIPIACPAVEVEHHGIFWVNSLTLCEMEYCS